MGAEELRRLRQRRRRPQGDKARQERARGRDAKHAGHGLCGWVSQALLPICRQVWRQKQGLSRRRSLARALGPARRTGLDCPRSPPAGGSDHEVRSPGHAQSADWAERHGERTDAGQGQARRARHQAGIRATTPRARSISSTSSTRPTRRPCSPSRSGTSSRASAASARCRRSTTRRCARPSARPDRGSFRAERGRGLCTGLAPALRHFLGIAKQGGDRDDRDRPQATAAWRRRVGRHGGLAGRGGGADRDPAADRRGRSIPSRCRSMPTTTW